ncbi:MAG: YggT family protein [Candidatus Saccharibacteria bacterium]|nr:YggT family protein [Candidatus Saccharibacteria bacterium]
MFKVRDALIGLINLVVVASWSLLGLRFILRLFSANEANGFVEWVYRTSGEVLAPFRGIFPDSQLEGFTFDFTALFAMMVYGLIALLAIYLVNLLSPVSPKKR